jgi:hypothetical protein
MDEQIKNLVPGAEEKIKTANRLLKYAAEQAAETDKLNAEITAIRDKIKKSEIITRYLTWFCLFLTSVQLGLLLKTMWCHNS